jgi:hypothetical protein
MAKSHGAKQESLVKHPVAVEKVFVSRNRAKIRS